MLWFMVATTHFYTAAYFSTSNLGAVVDAFGGGILNTGALTVRASRFVHNRALGADGASDSIGSSALGGAIMSMGTATAPATATVSCSTFLGNEAIARRPTRNAAHG